MGENFFMHSLITVETNFVIAVTKQPRTAQVRYAKLAVAALVPRSQ